MSDAMPLRHVYRSLLRAAAASVRFSRPAARSMKQLLREDMEACKAAGSFNSEWAMHTLAFFLFAAQYNRPMQGPLQECAPQNYSAHDSATAVLSHKCIANCVSLAYHHLSPNTQMQSLRKRAGGTDKSTAPKKTSVFMEALMQVDGIEQSSKSSIVHEEHVDTLRVKPKPIRGPVGQKQLFWDAQHPEKHIPTAKNSAELAVLQQYAQQLASKLQEMTEEYGQEHKLVAEMRTKLVHLRGTMKGMRKAEAQREHEAALAMCPVKAMEQVVQGLVDSEHIWLGLSRWHKKGNNKYLAP